MLANLHVRDHLRPVARRSGHIETLSDLMPARGQARNASTVRGSPAGKVQWDLPCRWPFLGLPAPPC